MAPGCPWVAPGCRLLRATFPQFWGKIVWLLLLGEGPWGSFVVAVGRGIFGDALPVRALGGVRGPPLSFSGPRRLLNLLFTAGKRGGRRGWAFQGWGLGAALLSFPKKVPSPFCPFPGSLGSGRLSSEAGWSLGSLGIRLGFKENL